MRRGDRGCELVVGHEPVDNPTGERRRQAVQHSVAGLMAKWGESTG